MKSTYILKSILSLIFFFISSLGIGQNISILNEPIIYKLNIFKTKEGNYHYLSRTARFINSKNEFYVLYPNSIGNCNNFLVLSDSMKHLFNSLDSLNELFCDKVFRNTLINNNHEIDLDSNKYINSTSDGEWSKIIESSNFFQDLVYDSLLSVAFIIYGEYYLYDNCNFHHFNDTANKNIELVESYKIDFQYSNIYYLIPKKVKSIKKLNNKIAKKMSLLKNNTSKINVLFGEGF